LIRSINSLLSHVSLFFSYNASCLVLPTKCCMVQSGYNDVLSNSFSKHVQPLPCLCGLGIICTDLVNFLSSSDCFSIGRRITPGHCFLQYGQLISFLVSAQFLTHSK